MKTLCDKPDSALAVLFNEGSSDAFAEIYNRYWQKMYGHARRMVKDDEQAADVLQDVFTKLLEKKGKFELKSTIASFLYTSLRNHILNIIAKERIRDDHFQLLVRIYEDGHWQTDEAILARELTESIDREIELLHEQTRTKFKLSWNEQLSHKEIAVRTGTAEETVKKQLYLAIKTLRSRIARILIIVIG
ncbi:sigma-70 family RNA polymerase sigma factor [Chitinophaga sp. MM2321]|uniref:RNA polymerase sigma factor n=1 Tax=Chitinophaga sp. MM2321 TaxID=3137178 RepID=UPI0032D5843E